MALGVQFQRRPLLLLQSVKEAISKYKYIPSESMSKLRSSASRSVCEVVLVPELVALIVEAGDPLVADTLAVVHVQRVAVTGACAAWSVVMTRDGDTWHVTTSGGWQCFIVFDHATCNYHPASSPDSRGAQLLGWGRGAAIQGLIGFPLISIQCQKNNEWRWARQKLNWPKSFVLSSNKSPPTFLLTKIKLLWSKSHGPGHHGTRPLHSWPI